MDHEHNDDCPEYLRSAVEAEIDHIRKLGSTSSLRFASANLGAYEALLSIVSGGECGIPIYQAIANVRSRFTSQAGIITRIRAMRELGLIEERPGRKRSQVCLTPSAELLSELKPILLARYRG